MRILVFGNSITQGFYDTECGGWVNRLAIHCMQKDVATDFATDHYVFNLGISGESAPGIAARFQAEIAARKGRNDEGFESIHVVLAIGINDSQIDLKTGAHRTPVEEYRQLLREMVQYAEAHCAGVTLVGLAPIDESVLNPIPWKPTHAYTIEAVGAFNSIIESVAHEEGVAFISLETLFGEEVARYTIDGIHPNAEGHRLIFEKVKNKLESLGVIKI